MRPFMPAIKLIQVIHSHSKNYHLSSDKLSSAPMAFNWQTFKTRTLTAILFAAVMLVGLLWNQWSFLILFSIIHFGCWWEYFNLLEKIHNTSFHRYTRFGFMLIGFVIMLWFCGPAYKINNYGVKENFSFPVSVAGFVLLGMGIFQKSKINLKAFGTAGLGLLYISLSWGLMMDIRNETVYDDHLNFYFEKGRYITTGLVYCIWINDTMAYIVGSLIGKTPLSPISPKKTWEGTLGGIVLCIILVGVISLFVTFSSPFSFLPYWIHYGGSWYSWVIIAAIAAIFSTFGDLLESKLKRMAGVKDSGNFMPGHGGFLDRFDSMLLATPAVWLYVHLIY